jgi:hypothetical protein
MSPVRCGYRRDHAGRAMVVADGGSRTELAGAAHHWRPASLATGRRWQADVAHHHRSTRASPLRRSVPGRARRGSHGLHVAVPEVAALPPLVGGFSRANADVRSTPLAAVTSVSFRRSRSLSARMTVARQNSESCPRDLFLRRPSERSGMPRARLSAAGRGMRSKRFWFSTMASESASTASIDWAQSASR